jgi:hypothetical protein
MTRETALPLSAEEELRREREACGECRESAIRLCPWHAGYEAGIRAHAIEAAARTPGGPGLRTALEDVRPFVSEEPASEGAGLHYAISQVRVLDYIDSKLAALPAPSEPGLLDRQIEEFMGWLFRDGGLEPPRREYDLVEQRLRTFLLSAALSQPAEAEGEAGLNDEAVAALTPSPTPGEPTP